MTPETIICCIIATAALLVSFVAIWLARKALDNTIVILNHEATRRDDTVEIVLAVLKAQKKVP